MDVYLISQNGVEAHSADELSELLDKPDALIWVDIPLCGGPDTAVLSEVFGFHEIAVRDCVQRNHVSKIHVYDDHVFTVLHAPELGKAGHVHYVELDQFLGRNYLVTVHGPLNPIVKPEVAFLDTGSVLQRLKSGHLQVRSPFELSKAIIGSLTRREIELIAGLAEESGRLEQRVMLAEVSDDPEQFLSDYQAGGIQATYDRMAKLVRSLPEAEKPLVADVADRFEQVVNMADGQREFLHGVIEFFQTRTSTHMTLAAEALTATSVQQNDDMRKITAWVAIVAVPTAVTGFFGQNVPYPGFGETSGFVASSLIMLTIAASLYIVFKRKTWL